MHRVTTTDGGFWSWTDESPVLPETVAAKRYTCPICGASEHVDLYREQDGERSYDPVFWSAGMAFRRTHTHGRFFGQSSVTITDLDEKGRIL